MQHPTTSKGDIGVALVTADLIQQGCRVLMPVSATSPFDLGVLYKNTFLRVQVKYRTPYSGRVEVKPKRATSRFQYELNIEYDILAIYCPDAGVAYVPRQDGQSVVTLRVTPSKNNQKIGVNLFEDNTKFNTAWQNWQNSQPKQKP
jgi:hypothetical protein